MSKGSPTKPGGIEEQALPGHTITPMRAVCLILVVLVSACSVGRPPEDASGEEIYHQLCRNCHSADLSGVVGPPLGPGSDAASRPDEFLEFTIMNGRGPMPSFKASLDEAQLGRLIDYLREEQGK